MSQHTARPDQHGRPEDEEDATYPPARRPESTRPRRPLGRPAGDGGVGPDEPDDGEFELTGDNDLGQADLGPAAPDARDPDADSGRIRKITR